MTSVLTRMARRALGMLPTAEPLKPSRYESEPLDLRPAGHEEHGPAFEIEPRIEARAAPMRQLTAGTPSDTAPPGTAPLHASAPEAARRQSVRTRDEEVLPAIERPRQADRPMLNTQVGAIPVGLAPQSAVFDRSGAPDVEPPGGARPERWLEPSVAMRDVVSAEELSLTPAPRRSESSRVTSFAARVEPATTPAEPSTEIHISIGAVELRVPRPEAKAPARQPFRPRTTLDEFLRRDRGASG